MKKGWIEFWTNRGWGRVRTEDRQDYFAHIRAFEPALPLGVTPVKGQLVVFDQGKTSRGPCALNIRIVSGGAR